MQALKVTAALSRKSSVWQRRRTDKPRQCSWICRRAGNCIQGRSMGCKNGWRMEEDRIKFLLCSTYDVLPTPTNLCQWGLVENQSCMLCRKPASLELSVFVLSSCQSSLADGKFRWRHDQIQFELVVGLEEERKKSRTNIRTKGPHFIAVVKAGESSRGDISWHGNPCLKKWLKFLWQITLRPDIVQSIKTSGAPWADCATGGEDGECSHCGALIQARNRRFHQKKACAWNHQTSRSSIQVAVVEVQWALD